MNCTYTFRNVGVRGLGLRCHCNDNLNSRLKLKTYRTVVAPYMKHISNWMLTAKWICTFSWKIRWFLRIFFYSKIIESVQYIDNCELWNSFSVSPKINIKAKMILCIMYSTVASFVDCYCHLHLYCWGSKKNCPLL